MHSGTLNTHAALLAARLPSDINWWLNCSYHTHCQAWHHSLTHEEHDVHIFLWVMKTRIFTNCCLTKETACFYNFQKYSSSASQNLGIISVGTIAGWKRMYASSLSIWEQSEDAQRDAASRPASRQCQGRKVKLRYLPVVAKCSPPSWSRQAWTSTGILLFSSPEQDLPLSEIAQPTMGKIRLSLNELPSCHMQTLFRHINGGQGWLSR